LISVDLGIEEDAAFTTSCQSLYYVHVPYVYIPFIIESHMHSASILFRISLICMKIEAAFRYAHKQFSMFIGSLKCILPTYLVLLP